MSYPSDEWRPINPRYIVCSAITPSIRWLVIVQILAAAYLVFQFVTKVPRADTGAAIPFGLGVGGLIAIELAFCVAFIALAVVSTVVRLRSVRYRLGGEEIVLKSGVLNQTSVTLPYARINSVETTSSLLERMFGLTSLSCQTASNLGNIAIPGLATADATSTRQFILDRAHASQLGEPRQGSS